MEQWYSAVTEYLQKHRDDIVEDIKDLVRIPSLSQAGKDGLPFGKDVDDALNLAAKKFNDKGIPMQVKHDHGYAIAVREGKGDGIGVFGHADVVPVNDDWVKTQPFEPLEENGVLYGRGVGDNKAGVIGSLYALKALEAAGVELKNRITIFVGGSEETGMKDLAAFVKNEQMPEVSIIPDSGFPVSVGEKGILRVDCRSRESLKTVRKFNGGQAYNVVLDYVTVEIDGEEPYAVEGLTSHGAHPENSINAAHKAAVELCEREDLDEQDRRILTGLRDCLSDCHGEALNIASEGVFSKLTCANGMTRVEEDGKLYFSLDIRYGNEFDVETRIPDMMKALEEHGFEGSVRSNDPGFLLDENGEAMHCILQSYRDAAGQPEAQPYKTFGGTYARKLKNAFAVNHSLPWNKAELGLPAGHGGAHQSDEVLCVDALLGGIGALALAIGRLDAAME